jgi:hypothetical protein
MKIDPKDKEGTDQPKVINPNAGDINGGNSEEASNEATNAENAAGDSAEGE